MNLIFATSNAHKVKEIASVLPLGYTAQSLKDIGFTDELPETHDTIEENSLEKAQYLAEKLGVTCFAEDTGLEIEALDGRPGVYSARYAGPQATFTDNVQKVLGEMTDKQNRKARFKTVITYYRPTSVGTGRDLPPAQTDTPVLKSPSGDLGAEPSQASCQTHFSTPNYVQFTGLCEGTILREPRGAEGFGYDPIFVPDGCNLSFAEMRLEEKNKYSHRKKAVSQFLDYLKSSPGQHFTKP